MLALVLLCLTATAFGLQDFKCDFESGLAAFVQKSDDQFDWTLSERSTPSVGTGPDGDTTQGMNARGHYIYIEASYPRQWYDKAILETRKSFLFDSGNKCLKFKYNMYSRDYNSHMGYLDVYIGGYFVWWDGGHSIGQGWKSAVIHIPSLAGYRKIAFEGIRGDGWQSDIAIDDIVLEDCSSVSTPAPPPTTAPPPPPPTTVATPPPPPPPTTVATPPPPPPPTTLAPPPPPPPTTSPSDQCGKRPTTRIVGGVDAKHGDWPWQAMLRTPSGRQFCGGALIAPQWVVSASHCVYGQSASQVHIRLGAHNRTSNVGTEQDFQVAKIVMHHSYQSPKTYSNDIALLKLDKPAMLNRYIHTVCLPDTSSPVTEGTNCWITGWGTLQSGGSQPETLQQAKVPIVHQQTCELSYPGQIDSSMICAGLKEGGIDACQGDSGGPMVCEEGGSFYLHGATSWGYGCAQPNKYGVYASVPYQRKWIDDEMKKY